MDNDLSRYFRFYQDIDESENPVNNVIAVYKARPQRYYSQGQWLTECVSAVHYYDNSPVATDAVSDEYLNKCKKITQLTARKIHSELFKVLDNLD